MEYNVRPTRRGRASRGLALHAVFNNPLWQKNKRRGWEINDRIEKRHAKIVTFPVPRPREIHVLIKQGICSRVTFFRGRLKSGLWDRYIWTRFATRIFVLCENENVATQKLWHTHVCTEWNKRTWEPEYISFYGQLNNQCVVMLWLLGVFIAETWFVRRISIKVAFPSRTASFLFNFWYQVAPSIVWPIALSRVHKI